MHPMDVDICPKCGRYQSDCQICRGCFYQEDRIRQDRESRSLERLGPTVSEMTLPKLDLPELPVLDLDWPKRKRDRW